ncbi:MarR family transcriptional regulator [bacterium]|nr:MarR family transcriptional regulator [bacterium]
MDYYALLLRALKQFDQHGRRCQDEVSRRTGLAELKQNQFRYLEIIAENDDLTPGGFAEILRVTRPSVSEIVVQLVNLDCVRKQQCVRDGRRYYIRLTERGQQIVSSRYLMQRRMAERIRRSLTDEEVREFVRLLEKIQ